MNHSLTRRKSHEQASYDRLWALLTRLLNHVSAPPLQPSNQVVSTVTPLIDPWPPTRTGYLIDGQHPSRLAETARQYWPTERHVLMYDAYLHKHYGWISRRPGGRTTGCERDCTTEDPYVGECR